MEIGTVRILRDFCICIRKYFVDVFLLIVSQKHKILFLISHLGVQDKCCCGHPLESF